MTHLACTSTPSTRPVEVDPSDSAISTSQALKEDSCDLHRLKQQIDSSHALVCPSIPECPPPRKPLRSMDLWNIFKLKNLKESDSLSHGKFGNLILYNKSQSNMLEQFFRSIERDHRLSENILLCVGIGLKINSLREDVPIRLPALLIPGLSILESLFDKGVPLPTLLVYQATDFIIETNGLDRDTATAYANKMKAYLEGYIHRLHPRIKHKVELRFHLDYPMELQKACNLRKEQISSMLTHQSFKKVKVVLEKNEELYSSKKGSSTLYAAANAIFSGVFYEDFPFKKDFPNLQAIFPIGGHQERTFFAITSQIGKSRSSKDDGVPPFPPEQNAIIPSSDRSRPPEVYPMVTSLGFYSTYYPHQDDPPLQKARTCLLPHTVQISSIRKDLEALIADGLTPEIFREIIG